MKTDISTVSTYFWNWLVYFRAIGAAHSYFKYSGFNFFLSDDINHEDYEFIRYFS